MSMALRPFRAVWGHCAATDGILARSPHTGMETLLPALAALGYRGVEMCLSHALTIGPSRMRDLLDASALKVGFIVFSDGPVAPGGDADGFMIFGKPVSGFSRSARPGDTDENRVAQRHFEVWREQVDAVREHFPNHCEFINSHSCKDYFTVGMAERFFDEALAHDKDVMHEGHRKRLCVCLRCRHSSHHHSYSHQTQSPLTLGVPRFSAKVSGSQIRCRSVSFYDDCRD